MEAGLPLIPSEVLGQQLLVQWDRAIHFHIHICTLCSIPTPTRRYRQQTHPGTLGHYSGSLEPISQWVLCGQRAQKLLEIKWKANENEMKTRRRKGWVPGQRRKNTSNYLKLTELRARNWTRTGPKDAEEGGFRAECLRPVTMWVSRTRSTVEFVGVRVSGRMCRGFVWFATRSH